MSVVAQLKEELIAIREKLESNIDELLESVSDEDSLPRQAVEKARQLSKTLDELPTSGHIKGAAGVLSAGFELLAEAGAQLLDEPILDTTFDSARSAVLDNAVEKLAIKERSGSNEDSAQWFFWLKRKGGLQKLDKLVEILQSAKRRSLTASELGFLKDALAIGRTNITPDRVQWTLKYSPSKVRSAVNEAFVSDNSVRGLEKAVLLATPLNPASDEWYSSLWTSFNTRLLKHPDAYGWYNV